VFSCVTFGSILLLPALIHKANDEKTNFIDDNKRSCVANLFHLLGNKIQSIRPSLTMVWATGHLLFAFNMFCVPFVRSVTGATFVLGLCGLASGLISWAPYALLGNEIAKMSDKGEGYEMLEADYPSSPLAYDQIDREQLSSLGEDIHESSAERRDSLASDSALSEDYSEDLEIFSKDPSRRSQERRLSHRQRNSEMSSHPFPVSLHESSRGSHVAGEMLGIMNVFVTLPQFIMSFVSGVLFAILEPGERKEFTGSKSEENHGVNAIAAVMVIGGVGSLVAAWLTLKLRRK
jgi:solute carrier family 45, member 1/2/4